MCEYCEKNKVLKSCNFAGSGEIRIYYKGFEKGIGMLELQGDGMKAKIFKHLYCPRFDILYCPMCRKEAWRLRYILDYGLELENVKENELPDKDNEIIIQFNNILSEKYGLFEVDVLENDNLYFRGRITSNTKSENNAKLKLLIAELNEFYKKYNLKKVIKSMIAYGHTI